jgi:hypothetical protein
MRKRKSHVHNNPSREVALPVSWRALSELKRESIFSDRLIPHHRHHLQKFGRALEASRWVFLQEQLKLNDERLRDFQSAKR